MTNQRNTDKQRVAAMAAAPLAVVESDKGLQAMLKVLSDPSEPQAVRLAALQSLGAAAFSVSSFAAGRADYIATLRKVADDPDLELRQRVLGGGAVDDVATRQQRECAEARAAAQERAPGGIGHQLRRILDQQPGIDAGSCVSWIWSR